MNRIFWVPHHRGPEALEHDRTALERFATAVGGTVPADYLVLADQHLGFCPTPGKLEVGQNGYRARIEELLGFTHDNCALTSRLSNMTAQGLSEGLLPVLALAGSVIAYEFRSNPAAPHLVHIASHEWERDEYEPIEDSLTELLVSAVDLHREGRTAVYLSLPTLGDSELPVDRLVERFDDLEGSLDLGYFYWPKGDLSLWVAPLAEMNLANPPSDLDPNDRVVEVLVPPDQNMETMIALSQEALSAQTIST